MKAKPSSYVLVAEILTIILFHAVKIRQTERHPAEIVFTQSVKNIPLHQPVLVNKMGIEYMLVNLVK
jgi:hypothetical protein